MTFAHQGPLRFTGHPSWLRAKPRIPPTSSFSPSAPPAVGYWSGGSVDSRRWRSRDVATARSGRWFRASLLAGRAVRRRTHVPGSSSAAALAAASCTIDGRRCPTQEKTQCSIVGTFVCALAQGIWTNSAEHGTTDRIHNRHHDLGAARRVEHDPVDFRAATRDPHKFARVRRFHRSSVLPRKPEPRRNRSCSHEAQGENLPLSVGRFSRAEARGRAEKSEPVGVREPV